MRAALKKTKSKKVAQRASIFPEPLESRQLMTAVNPVVIDVFIGYTAAARAEAGGTPQMLDKVNRSMAFLNQTMANSKVNAAMRLVGAMETNYAETGQNAQDFPRLENPSDGFLDDLTTAAANAGADITSLVVKEWDIGGKSTTPVNNNNHFNISLLSFFNNGVFNHETGHTLGGGHARAADDMQRPVPYAYEQFIQFGDNSVAGAITGSLPYYSNPNVLYRGKPTGTAGTGPDAADNARAINNNVTRIANTRMAVVGDNKGPVATLGSIQSLNGQNAITFKVRYYDDSGVNTDTLGNNNVRVNGAGGLNALATLTDIDDRATNYAYKVATYRVETPGAVGALNTYTFSLEANSVKDVNGNAAPAGPIANVSPFLPDYAGGDFQDASEEGDLAGRSWQISDEIGSKYQGIYMDPAAYRFSLSAQSTLTIARDETQSAMNLFQDRNNNLRADDGELIAKTTSSSYANLPAGENYYLQLLPRGDYKTITVGVSTTGQLPPPPPPPPPPAPGQPVSLTGSVFNDLNNDGIKQANEPGIEGVQLSLTGTDDTNAVVNLNATTNAEGVYTFNHGRASSAAGFTLSETQPANFGQGTNRTGNFGGTIANDVVTGIVLTGGANASGYTFAEQANAGSIRGFAYTDANNNGEKDANEQGIAGVAIALTGQNDRGEAVNSIVNTNAAGEFVFSNLRPANAAGYTITETQPLGVPQGQNKVGSAGGAIAADAISGINIATGTAANGYLFGEGAVAAPSSLGGFVYSDLNNNGIKEEGEPGIQGVWVEISGINNMGEEELRAMPTRADGSYNFILMPPSNAAGYKLEQFQPDNVIDGLDTLGNAGGQATPKNAFSNIVLAGGVTCTGYNFGEQPLGATPPAPPVVTGGNANTPENTDLEGNVLDGEEFARGTPLVYTQIVPGQGPQHAFKFRLNRDGSYSYTPLTNYNGPDSFTFQGVDANGRISTATVNIDVTPVNQPPQPNDENSHFLFVQQTAKLQLNLFHNQEDPDGDHLTFQLKKVTGGTAKILPDGCTLEFTPDRNFEGLAKIEYKCSDGVNTVTSTLSICVVPVEQAPKASNDSAVTLPSTSIVIDAKKNDSDADGDTLFVSSVGGASNGTVSIDTRGTASVTDDRVVYRPNFGFHGTDTFTYQLSDFGGLTSTGKVTVSVKSGAGIGIDPVNAGKSALDVFGTSGKDTINITKQHDKYLVTMNGILLGRYSPSGIIAVFAAGGNDTVNATNLDKTVWLFGDDGNDKLTGGTKNDLIVGGKGADSLHGGSGDDRLVGGTAAYESRGFGPLKSLFNSGTPLGTYLRDDTSKDELSGNAGKDVFYARTLSGGTKDKLHDRLAGEVLIDIA